MIKNNKKIKYKNELKSHNLIIIKKYVKIKKKLKETLKRWGKMSSTNKLYFLK